MAIIKCKMCGGDLVLMEGQSVAECEYCGSRQTVPAADNEKKLNLFAGANKLRLNCEFDRAAGIYDTIKAEFPDEAEAYWGLVLCKYGIEYVDDPATSRKVPTCHRVSYDSVMDDANLELAMDYADAVARKVYREEAKLLEKIRTGILEVSSREKPYDIFICYKETDENGDRTLDSVLAQDLYGALTEKGYRVFFSRITLQSKLGEAYEPYIFAALNSAKVMLAIGTDPEYYNAVWVKNEWSRYLKICAQDKGKHLIPCYKDMDAYDMPREFRPLQGVDLGKMGAVQDILFNMEKYIPLKKQNTSVIQEKVVVGGSGGSNKIASLLDRGNMALEDGDWAKADSFFEDVLNNDSKNAQAYLGKTLAQEKCRTMDALIRKRRDAHQNADEERLSIREKTAHITEMAEKFSLLGYVKQQTIRDLYSFDLSYTSQVSGWEKEYREEENWWQNHKWLSRAEKFAADAVADTIRNEKKRLFAQLSDRVKKAQETDTRSVAKLEAAYDAHTAKADAEAEKLYTDGIERREKEYQNYLRIAKNEESIDQLEQAEIFFFNNRFYKDSKNLAEHCQKRIADITAEQERREAERKAAEAAEAERRRIAEEKAAAARKKRNTVIGVIAGIAVVAAIAVFLVVTKVVIPGNAYNAAEALLANGQYEEAIAAFEALGDYHDAQAQAELAEELKIAAEKKAEEERLAAEKKAEEERLAAEKKAEEERLAKEYDAAAAMLESGDYENAAAAFKALSNYNDSREQWVEAVFYHALVLLEQQDCENAYKQFIEIYNYKDVTEYLDDFYLLPITVKYAGYSYAIKESFGYDSKGRMISGEDTIYTLSFDSKGRLIFKNRTDFTSKEYGTDYIYNAVGTITEKERISDDPEAIYDQYGNILESYYYGRLSGNYSNEHYDKHHNYTTDATNYYDAKGNLLYVERNGGRIAEFTYQYLYLPNGGIDEAVMEQNWINIRLALGKRIWGY